MTPNAGFGANCAIESAACLANVLDELMHQTHDGQLPACSDIQRVFGEYQRSRIGRVKAACITSYFFTRLQALDNKVFEILYTRINPMLGEDFEINILTNIVLGGSPLNFVKFKGKEGTVPWAGWEISANTNANQVPILSATILLLSHITPTVAGFWLIQCLEFASGSSQIRGMDSSLHPWLSLGPFGNLLAVGTVIAAESFRGSSINAWNVL